MSLRHQDAMVDSREPVPPDEQIVRTETDESVLRALSLISPRQRDCLVLRFYLELTESEISQTLSISPNSVKTHCQRGMAALEKLLEPSS
jgi:RNA polymerase sigma factor (sigma-70 family)